MPARTAKFTYTQGLLTSAGTIANPSSYASSITYHPSGMVNTVNHANGVIDTQAADPNGMTRPASISAAGGTTLWSSGAYAYDGAGNVTRTGGGYYIYDNASRLREGEIFLGSLGSSGGFKIERATYDPFGNMQTRSVQTGNGMPVPVDVTTNSATNQLSAASYDTAGNLFNWNGQAYTYDAFNQATHVTIGSEDWLHFYTADDERVWSYKLGGAPFNRWTIRGLGNEVLREFDSDNSGWHVEKDYIHRNGQLLASEGPQGVRHFHLDHLGTPRAISDSVGSRLSYHAYLPFGEEATAINQDTERRKFASQERDLGSTVTSADDVDYLHARGEIPALGRFLSPDPVRGSAARPQTWNQYAYVANQPVNFFDGSGRYREDFHFVVTEVLALAAGYSPADAHAIAAATQLPDDDGRSPTQLLNFSGRSGSHFVTGARLQKLADAAGSGRSYDIGSFLHALQDSFSHAGYGSAIGHIGSAITGFLGGRAEGGVNDALVEGAIGAQERVRRRHD